MTKKELKELYRAAHGPKWFEDPEVYAEYKLRRRPGKPAPAKPRPSRKKPRRSYQGFAKEHGPRLLGGGVIITGTRKEDRQSRPLAVVQVGPNKVRAFYMSTGTGGETEAGEWNLFGGIADEGYGAALGWFIKPKGSKRVAKYAPVSAWLARTAGDNAVDAAAYMKQKGFPTFSITPAESRSRHKLLKAAEEESAELEEIIEREEAMERKVRDEGGDVYKDDRVVQIRQERGALDRTDMQAAIKRYQELREKQERGLGRKLNHYLGTLGAIYGYEEDPREQEKRAEAEGHGSVHRVHRVAFNPRW